MKRIYKTPAKLQTEKKRCVMLAEYIVDTNGTVRDAAKMFGISKSTVHKDITEKLKTTDKSLYAEVRKVMLKNKDERHIRGGEATKRKYEAKKKAIIEV